MKIGRWFAGASAALAAVAVLLVPAPAQAQADVDGDGLADALEDAVAARYFPWVWFDSGEDAGCTHPASTTGNPGTVLARVRKHPQDASKIAIQYVILYRQDCGDIGALTSHFGDAEPVSVTLAPNPACPTGYGVFAMKTVAHTNAIGEHTDQRYIGNRCDFGRAAGGSDRWARILVSENKHGNYIYDGECDGAVGGLENCSESFTLPFNVYNAGEDHARRIDYLANYQFPGEYAWTGVKFRGSLGDGGGDAGYVRDKLLDDSLLAIGFEPPPSTRCNQPATAWYQTPTNDQNIRQGGLLLVIAAGVQPDSNAVFQFFQGGTERGRYQTRWANDNCVINQEYWSVNLAPGAYQVSATYEEPVSIGGSVTRVRQLPDLNVQTPPPPPPPRPPGCQPRRPCTL